MKTRRGKTTRKRLIYHIMIQMDDIILFGSMWIKGCAKASEIAKIEYGAPIPEEYQSEVLKDYLAEMAADKEVK